MTDHETLMERASAAIHAVFGDTEVGKATTRESLESLKEEIDELLDSLGEDE